MAKSKTPAAKENTSKCPITREQFADAKPLVIEIDGKQVVAPRKDFSSGSFGWYANEKVVVTVDGTPVKVQANISLVVVSSKDLPKE